MRDLPVHEDTTATIKTILNECVAGWEVFEEVLILDIVNFHNLVIETLEQLLVQW